MLIGSIGDIHGRDTWKEMVKNNKVEKWIFLGDYCDSFDKSDEDIKSNLISIINFKKNNIDDVVLLLGNHDVMYVNHPNYIDKYRCSGYRTQMHFDLYDIFYQNKNMFQYAYSYKDHLWTHAGVQHDWFVNKFKGDLNKDIADQLNNPISREQFATMFDVGHARGGRNNCGGPLWCDFNELKKPLKNVNQIVGHTHRNEIFYYQNKNYNASVYFVDVQKDEPDDKFLILSI